MFLLCFYYNINTFLAVVDLQSELVEDGAYVLISGSSDGDKLSISVAVRVVQIGSINIKEQSFKCRFDLFIDWNWRNLASTILGRVGEEERAKYENSQDARQHFEPVIRFPNADDYKLENKIWLTHDGDFVGYRVTVTGDFRVEFQLADFPFDVQRLCLELQLGREKTTHTLMPYGIARLRDSPYLPNILQQQHSSEYIFMFPRYQHRHTGHLDGMEGEIMSLYHLSIPIIRMFKYYLVHLYSLVLSFQLLAFGMFAMHIQSENRLLFIATLILVFVAFKMQVSQDLPKNQEMTHLDMYLYCAQSFFFVLIVHAIVCISWWDEEDETAWKPFQTERVAICCYGAIVFFSQVFFVLRAYRHLRNRDDRVTKWGEIDPELLQLMDVDNDRIQMQASKGKTLRKQKSTARLLRGNSQDDDDD